MFQHNNANLKLNLHYNFFLEISHFSSRCFHIRKNLFFLTFKYRVSVYAGTHDSSNSRNSTKTRPVFVFCRWISCCGRLKRATVATELLSRYASGIFNRRTRVVCLRVHVYTCTRRVHTRVWRRERSANRRRRSGR